MFISLHASPAVAFGTPARMLPEEELALFVKTAAGDPEVAEAHLISFRELNVMQSSELTVALITRAGSAANEVARRVNKAVVELASSFDHVVVIGLPIDHHLVNPIRCIRRQIVFNCRQN